MLDSAFCDLHLRWSRKTPHCSLVLYETTCEQCTPRLEHGANALKSFMCRDPQRTRTDAELISVLQRAHLLPADGISDPVAEAKFGLNSVVGDEGKSGHFSKSQSLR